MELFIYNRSGKTRMHIRDYHWSGPRAHYDHIHPTLEISCALAGQARYYICGQIYDVQPGDIFLLPNTDPHGLEIAEKESIVNLVVEFDPALLWEISVDGPDYNFLPIFYEKKPNFSHRLDRRNPATARIAAHMRAILQEATEQNVCHELVIQQTLLQIFIDILRFFDYVRPEEARSPVLRRNAEQLLCAVRHIDDHLAETIRLEDLAAAAHMSPTYFSALFKRYSGQSPINYILSRRIRAAIDLLRTTDQNIADIAAACGFNTNANFYKSFKRLTGRTPKEFRLRSAEENSHRIGGPAS